MFDGACSRTSVDGDEKNMTNLYLTQAFEDELLPSVYIASKSKSSAHTCKSFLFI